MKFKLFLLSLLIGASSIAMANIQQLPWSFATAQSNHILTLYKTGVRDDNPNDVKMCHKLLDGISNQLITIAYKIPSIQHELGSVGYLTQKVRVYPLGIANEYAFMSDSIPSALASKGIIRVGFTVTTSHQLSNAYVLFHTENSNVNCAITGN